VTPPVVLVTLFGRFHLQSDNQPLTLPTAKSRALLAFLIIEPQRPHRRHSLAALFWPQLPTRRALHNLTIALSAIRQLCPAAAPLLYEPDSETVALQPDAWQADVRSFCAASAAVEQHAHRDRDRCPICAVHDRAAADLAGGPLLADLDLPDCEEFHDWLILVRQQYHDLVFSSRLRAARFALNTGDFEQARSRLQAIVRAEPWREEVVRELMRVHAALGERTTALRLYQRTVDVVRRHFTLDVEPQTAALAAAVRDGTLRPPAEPLLRCPPLPTPLFERPQLAIVIDALLQPTTRLLSLVGLAGSGKSYLARTAARRLHGAFDGGIITVNCETLASAPTILLALAVALECPLSAGSPVEQQLAAALSGRNWLLLLDDLSALAEPAVLLSQLLAAAPQLTLLITAHQPCGLRSERVIDIGSFAVTADPQAEAVQFLISRCHDLLPLFDPAAALPSLQQIAEAVGGLPLALELAVHRLRSGTPQQLAERLNTDPTELDSDLYDLPLRHRRLSALLNDDLQQLPPTAVELLTALSFAGRPLDPYLLAALARDNAVSDSRLLSERGLVQSRADGPAVHPFVRLLLQRGDAAVVARAERSFRHAVLAELAGPDLQPGAIPQPATLARLSSLFPDLRNAWLSACRNADTALLLQYHRALTALLTYLNWFDALVELLLAAADVLHDPVVAELLLAAARASLHAARHDQAEQLINRAIVFADDDAILSLRCATLQACLLHERGAVADACRAFAALPGDHADLPARLSAEISYHYARSAMVLGDLPLAQQQAEACLPAARAAGDMRTLVLAESILAQLPTRAGNYQQAVPLLEQVLIDARRSGLQLLLIQSLGNLALTRALAGRPAAEVLPLLSELESVARAVGGPQRLAVILHSIASSALAVAALPQARRALAEAAALALKLPPSAVRPHLLESLGWLALHEGRPQDAALLLQQAVAHPATSAFVRSNARRLLAEYRLPDEPATAPTDAQLVTLLQQAARLAPTS
jgi:DNA-binding SARP family transcriptional activator